MAFHCTGHRRYTKGCYRCQRGAKGYQAERRALTATAPPAPAARHIRDRRNWDAFNALGARLVSA